MVASRSAAATGIDQDRGARKFDERGRALIDIDVVDRHRRDRACSNRGFLRPSWRIAGAALDVSKIDPARAPVFERNTVIAALPSAIVEQAKGST